MEFLEACHPEWEQMWVELAEMPINSGDAICLSQGKGWEYMGSTVDHHHLRHANHPKTSRCEFAYIERRCSLNSFGYDSQLSPAAVA